ncbi:hypothetical protein ABEX00_05255 [Bacillus safensis]
MGIILAVIIIILLVPVIVTIIFYIESYYKKILKSFNQIKKVNQSAPPLKWRELKGLLKSAVVKCLFISSPKSWVVWLGVFLFFAVLFVEHFALKDFYFYIGVVFLLYLAILLTYKHNNSEVNFLFYLTKLLIVLIYPLSLTLVFLENISNIMLIPLITCFTVLYLFLFLKSTMDIFRSAFFNLANLISVYLLFHIIIGIVFGSFYYYNNSTFGYFNNIESTKDELLLIIYKGLEPLYNYPTVNIEKGIMGYIPIFEYITGDIFTVIFVGIFISYFSNKYSANY